MGGMAHPARGLTGINSPNELEQAVSQPPGFSTSDQDLHPGIHVLRRHPGVSCLGNERGRLGCLPPVLLKRLIQAG